MKEVPIIVVLKAIGMLKDEDIMKAISSEKMYDEVLLNLFEFAEIKDQEEAVDFLARKSGFTQAKEIRVERARDMLDKFLLPHLGRDKNSRKAKAQNLCKMLKKIVRVQRKVLPTDDKDHYMNKRLRLSGNLLTDLFQVNFKLLVNDILYNFQRIIKRGKLPSIKVIIREKLLTSRIYSAMATGEWVGGRQGVSQRIDRVNFLAMVSHLQKVNSPLSSSQENFEARALHCTHIGRLCPIETPEGTNIGLRKNLAMLCSISQNIDEQKLLEKIEELGVKAIQ
jgi:DNA-directed RNA polymerase subunit B"